VIRVGLRRILPLDWDDVTQDEETRQFFGEAAEHGLGRKGMSFPVHGCCGDRALFSVTADAGEGEWRRRRGSLLRQLPIVAAHIHDAVLRTDQPFRSQPLLSPRELECLQWTAEGKTVWECGVILGLSPHTVRCYMESARHKLGASSNTHAVSLALQTGRLFQRP
jgi:DNA-binding CsgD family transcriptional regulator